MNTGRTANRLSNGLIVAADVAVGTAMSAASPLPESVTVCFLSREPATDSEDYESCSLSGTSYN